MKMEDLVKPSIFDTDEIKETKHFIVEIQEYIDEIAYLEANKEALKKEQEAKELAKQNANNEVPEGFGKPQANAEQFKEVSFTLKKKTPAVTEKKDGETESKKRTFQEMQKEQKHAGVESVTEPTGEKRQKSDGEAAANQKKEIEKVGDKENAVNNQ